MATSKGPVIRLQGGPGAGQQFFEDEFLERIRAAQRMGRTAQEHAGWALCYERPPQGHVWIWREGVNCHPRPID